MSKPHQEQLLQELITESKQQVTLPNEVTSNVLRYAKESQYPFAFLMRWQTICAIFLVGWLWFDISRTDVATYSVKQEYTEDNRLVYYHEVSYLTESDKLNQSEPSVKITKTPQYLAYMDSLSKLQNGNQMAGIVRQSGHEVLVEICQLGLVKLSENVLSSLNTPVFIDKLKVGQNILLLADNTGQFFSIENDVRESDSRAEQCAE